MAKGYKTDLTESISIRITKEQKELFDKLTTESNNTLKDYILGATIESNHVEEVKELEQRLTALSTQLKDMEGLGYEVERLTAALESKDERIKDLSNQLQYANERLTDNHTLISQQQQLNLATLDSNKSLKLELDSVKNEVKKEVMEGKGGNGSGGGFFSRLFKG